MAIEILVEIVGGIAAHVIGRSIGKRVRSWRMDSFYEDLGAAQKRAFIEVFAAAALQDGSMSDDEKETILRLGSEATDIVTMVTKELPFPDPAAATKFLTQRADVFESDEQRERVFTAAALALVSGQPMVPGESLRLFGEALRVPAESITKIGSKLHAEEHGAMIPT